MMKCYIDDCGRDDLHAHGLCQKHYRRWQRYGDPEFVKQPHEPHGMWGTPTYDVWESMKSRCTSRGHTSYKWYGQRGIRVCDEWRHSFNAFLRDMGLRPDGRTLDRIDCDGHYEKSNCRWSTPKEQAQNRHPRGYLNKQNFEEAA